MKNSQIISLTVFLCVICAIASGILAIANQATEKDIAKMKAQKTVDALKTVLGQFDNDPVKDAVKVEYDGEEVLLYPAKKNGKLVSCAASSSSPKGYGGKVAVMAQVFPDGKVGAVIVTEQNETPGLGTAATNRTRTKTINDVLSGKKDDSLPPNQMLDSFKDKNCASAPWKIRKYGGEIDSITGATISSSAVLDAVNRAAAAFEANKAEICPMAPEHPE